MEEGGIVTVDMNGVTVVPGFIIDAIKGRSVTMCFDMGGGIMWSVDGRSVLVDKAEDIDFAVKKDTEAIPDNVVQDTAGDRQSLQISLAHEGEFGFNAVLSVNLGSAGAGLWARLYYYGGEVLELICEKEIAEDGTVQLQFEHASDYLIVIGEKPEKDNGESQDPDGAGSVPPGFGEDMSSVPPGSGEDVPSAGRAEGVPDSGSGMLWWILVPVVLLLLAGIAILIWKKLKKRNREVQ